MNIELISFKVCPFVQRSVITLIYKKVPFDITYIDLAEPPDWFAALSPFGKVPLLKVNHEHVIFESAVINEFLDETTPGTLLPQDPIQRALNRSWTEFGSAALSDLGSVFHAADEQAFVSGIEALREKIRWVEGRLTHGPYFDGEFLSLVDFAYAPLFMRLQILGLENLLFPEGTPTRAADWSAALLQMPAVQNSVVPAFEDLLKNFIKKKSAYTAGRLGIQ